ncbi:MAG: HAMP domain-containing protein, partial [Oscillospiraceae bacterium]|nr:HAMP domain-containing protein [Oscillospiraceae bacterium]
MNKRWSLTVSLVLFVFSVMMAALVLAGLIVIILHLTGALSFWYGTRPEGRPFGIIFIMMGFSILLGTALAGFFGKKALNPIRKVIEATHRVAEGDFNVRVELKGIQELEELSQSFNKMAHELSTIETLRSDFINNFSHEF